jgi:ubiquinone/menaquinone biosynthesis C-methylase UbiE
MKHANYDEISTVYDQRYAAENRNRPAAALQQVIDRLQARCVLEAGCGTGHWLSQLRVVDLACGLDNSAGMLANARQKTPPLDLTRASAHTLPYARQSFDFVYCINALHHFNAPQAFISEARRVLRPGGALSLIGMDPHSGKNQWYLYDYFPGTYEADLARYPSSATMNAWLQSAGFTSLESTAADQIYHDYQGADIFKDPMLQKNGTSQLALLSMDAFNQGMAHMREAVDQAASIAKTITFSTHIALVMITGYIPAGK